MGAATAAGKVATAGFPVLLRRNLAGQPDKKLRTLASKVFGAWNETAADVEALIAAKKKAAGS